jgi:LysM domain
MRTLLPALFLATSVFGQTPQTTNKAVPEQGPPPKKLSVRPDGHVSANQDPANPSQFEVRVVKKGDTLSQIAGEVLKNPRLWPQLWEQNEHIINPHWIYPDDKILIRPVVAITEAKPPEPEPPPPPPAPEPEPEPAPRRVLQPPPSPRVAAPTKGTLTVEDRRPVTQVKYSDLYCSGFVRMAPIEKHFMVTARFDANGAVLAAQSDYVYLSHGTEDGVTVGTTYQVVRPTKKLTNPVAHHNAFHDLGMHYLDVAQIRVVVAQPDFSLARITFSCSDAVEVGDLVMPFQQIVLPPIPRPRPFSPTMTASGGTSGTVVSANSVLLNFGSAFEGSGIIPGVRNHDLAGLTERGLAPAGSIVYVDVGEFQAVKPGDIFIVYRDFRDDERLFPAPREVERLEHTRTAVGEIIIMKVGERASAALVSYATDALVLGDTVERR